MYGADLAIIHHEGFGGFARGAAPGLLAVMKAHHVPRGSTVVDLGCGSGIWLAKLHQAGFTAVGIERSPALVALAKRTAPGAEIRNGSLYQTPIPKCHAVTALGEVLSYLPAASFNTIFRRTAAALVPGGVFAFDLMIRQPRPSRYRSWTAGPDWLVCVEVSENPARSRITRRIETFRRVGRDYRRGREVHRIRVADRAEIIAALDAAGFRARTVTRFGRYALAKGRLGFVAIKRASE